MAIALRLSMLTDRSTPVRSNRGEEGQGARRDRARQGCVGAGRARPNAGDQSKERRSRGAIQFPGERREQHFAAERDHRRCLPRVWRTRIAEMRPEATAAGGTTAQDALKPRPAGRTPAPGPVARPRHRTRASQRPRRGSECGGDEVGAKSKVERRTSKASDCALVIHWKIRQSEIGNRQACMPHLRTVRRSMTRKTRFSTIRPMMMTVRSPAKTAGISRVFLFSKMYQPKPPPPVFAP